MKKDAIFRKKKRVNTSPKELLQCLKQSIWQERQSLFCRKEKEQSNRSKSQDREIEDSYGRREPPLGKKEER